MKKSIQDYGVYSATDISGALKQTEFYLKSQPTDKSDESYRRTTGVKQYGHLPLFHRPQPVEPDRQRIW